MEMCNAQLSKTISLLDGDCSLRVEDALLVASARNEKELEIKIRNKHLYTADAVQKIYSDQEIINELKKLKPSQVSAMLSKSSSQSRDILYKRCMDLLNEKFLKK